jgi:hypothetical protein
VKMAFPSLLHLVFAGILIFLQLAGTSEDLHGWMHGEMGSSATCSHHEGGHCGSAPVDQPEEPCSEACAVMLLSGGLTLSEDFAVEPKKARVLVLEEAALCDRWLAGHLRTTDARAPPVL